MKRIWIVVATPVLALSVYAQGGEQAPALKPKGGLTGAVVSTAGPLEEDMQAAEDAAVVLGTSADPLQIARAHAQITGALNSLRPRLEADPAAVLPRLKRLEGQLVDASYSGTADEETQQALEQVVALRKVAVRSAAAIEHGLRRRTARVVHGVGGGVRTVLGEGGGTAGRAAPGSRVALLEAHYSELRALLAQPQPGGPALLAGMVALDLRTTQMAQDYPEDPAESEKLSLKLVEGEELMGDLARAAYLQYRTQIEGDPAEAMLAFSTFLRDAPLAAKRGRRQAGLLFSAARSVWHKEHLARDLFKVDGEQRCAALAAVGARWREAIGDEEGHPLQEDLDRLQRRLATVERGLR